MQTTENGRRVHRAGRGASGGPRRVEHQAAVGTFRVVGFDEPDEHRPEVPLVEDDQVVAALVAQSPDDLLGDCLGAGRPHWTKQGPDAQAPGPPDEVSTLDSVPVAHSVARLPAPRRRFNDLHQLASCKSDKHGTYSVCKVSVWTANRSAAQKSGRWLARKVRQIWLGGRAGPCCRYR